MDTITDAVFSSWDFNPWVLGSALVTGLLYARGWVGLHRRAPHRFGLSRLAAFYAGLAISQECGPALRTSSETWDSNLGANYTYATLEGNIAALEEALSQGFAKHPDAELLRSLPGLGVVTGARVLGENGLVARVVAGA